MKKKALLTAVIMCLLTFTGCMQSNADYIKNNNSELSIVTTCFPPYDFARAVKGDTAV